MTATIIDGKKIAEEILLGICEKVKAMKEKPGLALILVGKNPASEIYVNSKEKKCNELGIYCERYNFSEDVKQKELVDLIYKLNKDNKINGILVQLPLPPDINEDVINLIDPKKDVDGFTSINLGNLVAGNNYVTPATPKAILKLIEHTGISISGKNAVVVGRSKIVGKPVALLLLERNAGVTVCHSKTENLSYYTKQADILVVAVGKPKLITKDMIKKNAVVIDVGINRVNGKIVGDVDFENVREVASYITPVPGGVGPMTIAMLLDNLVKMKKP